MFGVIIAGLGCCMGGVAPWMPLGIDSVPGRDDLDEQQLPCFGSGAAILEFDPEQQPPDVWLGDGLGASCGLPVVFGDWLVPFTA